jgi:hypothetical protein
MRELVLDMDNSVSETYGQPDPAQGDVKGEGSQYQELEPT